MKTATARRGGHEFEELAPYLDTIREFPPLSREEEHRLAVRARRGDVNARQQLVRHNLAFVVAIARKQRRGAGPPRRRHPGGERRADARRREVRSRRGHPLLDLRGLVDPRLRREVPQGGEEQRPAAERDGRAGRPVAGQLRGRGERDDPPRADRGRRSGPRGQLPRQRGGRARSATRSGRIRKRVGELGWDIIHNRLQQDQPRTLEEIGKRWGVSRERVRQVELRTKQFLAHYLEPASATRPEVQRSRSRIPGGPGARAPGPSSAVTLRENLRPSTRTVSMMRSDGRPQAHA